MLNTYDSIGGAARSAYRLCKGMQGIGVSSRMLVQEKTADDSAVIGPMAKTGVFLSRLRPRLDRLPLRIHPGIRNTPWGLAWLPGNIVSRVARFNPDIVHLHWICGGFVPIPALAQMNYPLIWTLHDSWAFTGGCHLPYECTRYRNSCGLCPQLGTNRENDFSRWVWQRKNKYWKGLDLTIVTPSRWLAKCAAASSLFRDVRIEVIPNGLDVEIYKPVEQLAARDSLGLPRDSRLILFGAVGGLNDHNKGYAYLRAAVQHLKAGGWDDRAQVVVFGAAEPPDQPELGLKTIYLGRLYDDISLALLYSAADVFVAPSIQENLPNTVMEALACGTPCVAFDIGGMPDMIEHQRNGYLARPFEADDLARGIAWVLEDNTRRGSLSYRAREKVEHEFDIKLVAGRCLELYKEILSRKKG